MIDYGCGLTLGPLRREHLGLYQAWRNHSEIRWRCRNRHLGLLTGAHQERWYEAVTGPHSTAAMFEVLLDNYPSAQEAIGVGGLVDVDHRNRKAELSLYLDPSHSGPRVADSLDRAAIRTLIAYGFQELNLERIWCETVATFVYGWDTLEALGFEREGTLRNSYWIAGKPVGSLIHAMLRADWLP